MPATPQTFFETLRAAHATGDAEAYADLFDLPSISYVEGGPQPLRTPADLHDRLARLTAAMEALGVVGHRVDYISIRPYGGALVSVRAAVRLRLEGGLETDEREELWILRERHGRLVLCLTVNSTAGNVIEGAAGGEDGAAPKAEPTPAGAAFLAAMQHTFNSRDAEGHAALLDRLFLRVSDDASECMDRGDRSADISARFFEAVDRARIAGLALTPLAERPYGRDYVAMRVAVEVVFEDGRRGDRFDELWVLRQVDGHLRLGAIVNPFAPRFLSQDLPHRRPT